MPYWRRWHLHKRILRYVLIEMIPWFRPLLISALLASPITSSIKGCNAWQVIRQNHGSRNNSKSRDKTKNEEIRARRHEKALQDPSLLSSIRFDDRRDMHPITRKALKEGFGLQTMTHVQAQTYAASLAGRSILARSRTGTGKTLGKIL